MKREKEVDPLGIRAPVGATVGDGHSAYFFPILHMEGHLQHQLNIVFGH